MELLRFAALHAVGSGGGEEEGGVYSAVSCTSAIRSKVLTHGVSPCGCVLWILIYYIVCSTSL